MDASLVTLLDYAHPAVAAVGLGLAFYTLRLGFHLRDYRVRRSLPPKGALGRHLQLSQPAALVLALAFGLGVVSSAALRHWTPFTHAHGWAGLVASLAFGWTWWLGRGLKAKTHRQAQLHGVISTLAVLAGAVAAVTGIELPAVTGG